MTAAPEYGELHRLADRLTPHQVRALCAVALELVRVQLAGAPLGEPVVATAPTPSRTKADDAGLDLVEESQGTRWSELGAPLPD